DVAVVELNESGSESDDDEETSESEGESDSEPSVTEGNLRLPGDTGKKKANIQVLQQQGE
ncbi:hypothetical protein GOODEAATRI_024298, partial [Goodea atripinnis]